MGGKGVWGWHQKTNLEELKFDQAVTNIVTSTQSSWNPGQGEKHTDPLGPQHDPHLDMQRSCLYPCTPRSYFLLLWSTLHFNSQTPPIKPDFKLLQDRLHKLLVWIQGWCSNLAQKHWLAVIQNKKISCNTPVYLHAEESILLTTPHCSIQHTNMTSQTLGVEKLSWVPIMADILRVTQIGYGWLTTVPWSLIWLLDEVPHRETMLQKGFDHPPPISHVHLGCGEYFPSLAFP